MSDWVAGADLLVVGSGVAGLTAALEARALGLRVVVVTKAAAEDGNTSLAQGGVAMVAPDEGDTVHRHVVDTLNAGAGLCDEGAVRAILADGPAAIAALRRRGATFDRAESGSLARTREGGHSTFRVIHAGGDATGAEIERALLAAARVPILERHTALDVLRTEDGAVAGLLVLDASGSAGGSFGGTVGRLTAPAVLLATGGLGQLYTATTNPAVATGDGLALALRAGATAADLEFVQFHPTVLHTGPGARGWRPLVTEAVRGEGAVLVDATGARVMTGVHPLADLAPRDVVAAAITATMARTGTDHVLLDATGLRAFDDRFPTVWAACRAAGVDPSREPIPVTPAAHYACGGVASTVDGRTEVTGLYAAGEVARTGLHGANRLASNSLLEGLVVGTRAARAVAADLANRVLANPAAPLRAPGGRPRPIADRDVLQRAMSRHAGVGRNAAGLAAAAALIERSASSAAVAAARGRPASRHGGCGRLASRHQARATPTSSESSELSRCAAQPEVSRGTLARPLTGRDAEDAALTVVALATLAAAATRTETRGCHVRTDFPARDDLGWRRGLTVTLDERGRPVVTERAALAVGGAA